MKVTSTSYSSCKLIPQKREKEQPELQESIYTIKGSLSINEPNPHINKVLRSGRQKYAEKSFTPLVAYHSETNNANNQLVKKRCHQIADIIEDTERQFQKTTKKSGHNSMTHSHQTYNSEQREQKAHHRPLRQANIMKPPPVPQHVSKSNHSLSKKKKCYESRANNSMSKESNWNSSTSVTKLKKLNGKENSKAYCVDIQKYSTAKESRQQQQQQTVQKLLKDHEKINVSIRCYEDTNKKSSKTEPSLTSAELTNQGSSSYLTQTRNNPTLNRLKRNLEHIKVLQRQRESSHKNRLRNSSSIATRDGSKKKGLKCTLYEKSQEKKRNTSLGKQQKLAQKKSLDRSSQVQQQEEIEKIDNQEGVLNIKDLKKVKLSRKKDNYNSYEHSYITNQNYCGITSNSSKKKKQRQNDPNTHQTIKKNQQPQQRQHNVREFQSSSSNKQNQIQEYIEQYIYPSSSQIYKDNQRSHKSKLPRSKAQTQQQQSQYLSIIDVKNTAKSNDLFKFPIGNNFVFDLYEQPSSSFEKQQNGSGKGKGKSQKSDQIKLQKGINKINNFCCNTSVDSSVFGKTVESEDKDVTIHPNAYMNDDQGSENDNGLKDGLSPQQQRFDFNLNEALMITQPKIFSTYTNTAKSKSKSKSKANYASSSYFSINNKTSSSGFYNHPPPTINPKVQSALAKINLHYKFTFNYLTELQVIGLLNGYDVAKQEECKWPLLVIDQVYYRIKHSQETKLKGIEYSRDYQVNFGTSQTKQ